ncbi:MAG: hypothetical protein IT211_09460 [Armatimonadetes bacterium]|nr:hypothetical protein [Armatimonadota bacterium]
MKHLAMLWVIATITILSTLSLQARTAYPSENDNCIRYVTVNGTTIKLELCFCMESRLTKQVTITENGGDFYGETWVTDYNTIMLYCAMAAVPRSPEGLIRCRKNRDCL